MSALLALAVVVFIPLAFLLGAKPAGRDAGSQTTCAELIARAMQISGQSCDQTGPNQACYGNTVVTADLLPDTLQRFSEQGDVVDIDRLVRLSAAPLDLNQQVWGIAVLRLMANLPRSLPGETVTMIVFGNTTVGSQAPGLQSFYFYSEVGQIACAELPYDGILISMPNGAGINLKVNGAELTLNGDASLKATQNDRMDVSIFEGTARIVADGVEQYFEAGEQVSVDLGGEDGAEVIGPPSDPEPLSPEDALIRCTISGQNCPPTETPPVIGITIVATLPAASSTATGASTPIGTAGPTATSRYTPTVTFTPTRTPTSGPTLAGSLTPSPPISTASRTLTFTLTRTLSKTPTATLPAPSPTDVSATTTSLLETTAAPLVTGMPLDAFVVLGQEGVYLEQNGIVHSGSVGANMPSAGPYLSGSEEVVIGIAVEFQQASSLLAGDSIQIKNNATVYDVFYNEIIENGTVNGSHYTPLNLPLVASFPAVPAFEAGSLDFSLAVGESLTLDPGNYGQLDTRANATVSFTGGLYTFAGWSIGQDSDLLFLGPTEIRIAGRLYTNSGTFIGPADGSGLSAADILIIVTGINGNTGAVGATPKALQIGQANMLIANLYAPNGTLFLRQNTVATGAFLGRWVDIGAGVELTIESLFH